MSCWAIINTTCIHYANGDKCCSCVCVLLFLLLHLAVLCVLLENEQQFSSRFFNDFWLRAISHRWSAVKFSPSSYYSLFIGMECKKKKKKPRSYSFFLLFTPPQQFGLIFPPRFFSFLFVRTNYQQLLVFSSSSFFFILALFNNKKNVTLGWI